MRTIHLSHQSLQEYLLESLQISLSNQSLHLQDDTLAYVTQLAARFINSDQLFIQEGALRHLPTLAFLYRDALATSHPRERVQLIRTLGDTALFLAACFPNIWQRRGLNQRYFIDMGESAFGYLAQQRQGPVGPFKELEKEFSNIAHCLGLAIYPKQIQH